MKNGMICPTGTLIGSMYEDIDGNPVKRDRMNYPYSYDAYVQWRGGENSEIEDAVYHDRMISWDFNKFHNLCEKHFGNRRQTFTGKAPSKVESFLRDYFDKPTLRLIVIQECCNVSSGYPIWIFHYATK